MGESFVAGSTARWSEIRDLALRAEALGFDGRSAGVIVEPTSVTGAAEAIAVPIRGTPKEIAARFREFEAAGFTQLEVILWPSTLEALEAMAPVLEVLRADRRAR
jgi:alkanesulfonate monooxygenase SsuD/methylene tetrahydromethanopterin reductase-like flavin-dependent oxidoreductase (luciferase family)